MKEVSRPWSFQTIGAVYVLIVISAVFSVWSPDLFPRPETVRQVLNGNAIAALAALALVVPLSAGVFDISVAYTMSLSGVVAANFIANAGSPIWLACLLALLVSIGVGAVNGVVVVVMKIDSLIGTLATGALITAGISMVTHENSVTSPVLTGPFANLSQLAVLGLTLPVFYSIAVAFALWLVLEYTATGRRIYATGFNQTASRLAGVPTERIRFASLLVSAGIAGATGIVLASLDGSGSPTAGTPYLLSAFAAVFLGATQLKAGRFNAWGTIIAVLLLGVGVTGLGLANAPSWTGSAFTGVVLIAALAITGVQRRGSGPRSGVRTWIRLRLGRAPDASGEQAQGDAHPEPDAPI